MQTKLCRCFRVLVGLLLAGAAHAQTTFTVTNLLDGAPGSLRVCIAAAQSGKDTISFQPPSYANQTITITLTNELDITTNLTINGLGVGVLNISGQNKSRVFNISAGATVSISQLTVTNGLVTGNPGQGGGILNAGKLTLQNCTVTGNSAVGLPGGDGDGGGIYSSGPLMLQNCTISGNSANGGSGGNGIGGGIYSAIKLSLVNCLISSNSAANGNGPAGGGIEAEVSLAMTNCTISFNSINNGVIGPAGGGIDISGYGTNGTIVNCTIASNSVTGGDYNPTGAGIQISDGNCILICCTICGNSAGSSSYGGGIAINSTTGAGCTILNTIVSGNTDAGHSPDLDQGYLTQITHFSGGFNLIGNDAGAENVSWLASDQVGTSAQPIDPYLGPLQDNGGPTPTMAPTVFSRNVIDQGSSFGINTDQRGQPRPFAVHAFPIRSQFHGSDGSDIGAVELSYRPVLSITNTGLNTVVISWPIILTFTYTNDSVEVSPPDHGVGKNISFSSGAESTQPLTLHKHSVRIVDHQFKILDDMTDTDGVPAPIAFYQASSLISNPFVSPPITGPANNITAHAATLTGTNFPAGSNTVYWFVYGLDTNYGTFSVTNPLAISTNPISASTDISGLTASRTYHYQLMASDSDLPGLQYGGDQVFTTLASPATNWTLYVSSAGNNAIYKCDSNGVATEFATNGVNGALSSPEGLTLDSLGNLYVVNYTFHTINDTVEKYDAQGVGSVFATLTGSDGLYGAALDVSNNVYVADGGASKIMKITNPGGQVSTFASYASGATVDGPTGMTFDDAGNLWVANNYGGSIEKFDSLGNGTPFYKYSGSPGPFALAFDSGGNLYVTEANTGKIGRFAAGTTNRTDFATGLNAPSGLAFDSTGNLYVACTGSDTIVKITPQGAPSVFANASTGLKSPAFIVIQETR